MSRFDRTDYRILDELQKNARLSNKELAARVGLAPSSCLERVRRLIERGVFRSFHAAVDPRSLGIEIQAMVSVRLQQHSRDMVTAFQEHVLRLPEVVAAYHVSGENDYLIHLAVRSSDHLRETILDAFTTLPEVAHVETTLIFDHVRSEALPNYRAEEEVAGEEESAG